jgi:hypothetical protein
LAADLSKDDAHACVELAFEYHLDWELVDLAISGSGLSSWASTRRRVRPANVCELTGFGAGKLASESYLKGQAFGTLSRHHALCACSARALRVAYEAAAQMPAGANAAMAPQTLTRRVAVC